MPRRFSARWPKRLKVAQGTDELLRVTPSMLKEHRTRDDAWSAFNGKVYNLTHYLPYHPGGEKELMRVAGRDGSKLFGEFFVALDRWRTARPIEL